jgi:hypothetical protein
LSLDQAINWQYPGCVDQATIRGIRQLLVSVKVPPCQTVKVFAFRGDRSRSFAMAFQSKLDDEKNRAGPGPTMEECQLFAGHAGVSTDGGRSIYGFNPDSTGVPLWQLLNRLKSGDRFQGVVRDDISVFVAAQKKGLTLISYSIVLPDPAFQSFLSSLDAERRKSSVLLWLSQWGRGLQLHHLVGTAGLAVAHRPHG